MNEGCELVTTLTSWCPRIYISSLFPNVPLEKKLYKYSPARPSAVTGLMRAATKDQLFLFNGYMRYFIFNASHQSHFPPVRKLTSLRWLYSQNLLNNRQFLVENKGKSYFGTLKITTNISQTEYCLFVKLASSSVACDAWLGQNFVVPPVFISSNEIKIYSIYTDHWNK